MSKFPPLPSGQTDESRTARQILLHLQRLDLTDRATRQNLTTVHTEHRNNIELCTFTNLLRWNRSISILRNPQCDDAEAYDFIRLLPDPAGLLRRLRRYCPVSSQPPAPRV